MSFGFSVGDFLAVGRLVAQITLSLQEVGGSKSDYQELQRELQSLDTALKHVQSLGSITPTFPTATIDSIKCAILLCRHPLEEFLAKIQKYESGLGVWAKGGVKSTARKVDWSLRRREDVRTLRSYLSLHVHSINMLLLSHGLDLAEGAAATTTQNQAKLEELMSSTQQDVIENSRLLTEAIRGDIFSQSQLLKTHHSAVSHMFRMVSGDIVAPLRILADSVVSVCATTQQILKVVLEIHSIIPSVETRFTYLQAPVRVEDALGRIFPVPSEYSFGDLEALIQRKFRTGPGQRQVQAGEFKVFNSRNRKQVMSFSDIIALPPGMSMTMAIVVDEVPVVRSGICPMPRCGSESTVAVTGGGRKCNDCGVWSDMNVPPTDQPNNTILTQETPSSWGNPRQVVHNKALPVKDEETLSEFKNVVLQPLRDLTKSYSNFKTRFLVCKICHTHLAMDVRGVTQFRLFDTKLVIMAYRVESAVNTNRTSDQEDDVLIDGKFTVSLLSCRQCQLRVGFAFHSNTKNQLDSKDEIIL